MVAIGEHYRPTDGAVPPGVYRVVGTGDPVALLRVGTAEGRRQVTGELQQVSQETLTDAFEPAADPDAGFTPVALVRNALSGLFWQFRRFF